jgi:fibro-slime domain-containing protein
MKRPHPARSLIAAGTFALAAACGSPSSPASISNGGNGRTDGGAAGIGKGGGSGATVPVGGGGSGAAGAGSGGDCTGDDCVIGCGNGRIDPGLEEACDDANIASGDGCSADCKAVERDYACLEPGMPCASLVVCGDGKLMGMETCDDGNTRGNDGCSATCTLDDGWDCTPPGALCIPRCGDGVLIGGEECDGPNVGVGCSATCRLEPGFACDPPSGAVPASCHRTTCGDTTKEGSEACDDGNTIDGDGCSGGCTFEPDCQTGTCTSRCGDGIKLAPEACDDGNNEAGDGCGADCTTEVGFTCDDDSSTPPGQLNLAVTYRDFNSFPTGTATRHPDFESAWAGDDVTPGLARTVLDAMGKPEMDGRCSNTGTAGCPYGQMLSTAANFATWFRTTAGVNVAVPGALLLARGANGAYAFDSANRGFYPIDGRGFTAAPATETTAIADPAVNDGRAHNFGFSSELRYFFQYSGGETLAFSGDDDLWVFINRRLALDVGGLHTRVARTLTVDTSAAALGLTLGGLYEIVLFHAERHSAGSNFRLTLTGFAPTRSTCHPTCGDGIVAPSEQCDLGTAMNTGSYNGCTADCRRGPFCGDGVVQASDETCDDGLNVTPYGAGSTSGCAPGCLAPGRCGDGNLDSLFGEQCDDGENPPMTSSCSADCRLGARCGDGILQPELGESCDDGNTVSGDSCTYDCQPIVR